jgi:Carboxypeptidase regulatory-like domain
MGVTRLRTFVGVLVLALAVLFCGRLNAGVTASISGTVMDASGAAVAGATVTATNIETGVTASLTTNGQGYYSFQSLALGKYTIDVQQKGFKAYQKTGVVLDVNDALVVDVQLQVGSSTEKVVVQSDALHVETANTQLGEVIEGKQMTAVPLVTRSYTDLLALQPGVVSQTSGLTGAYAGAFLSATFAIPQVSGDLNAGQLSVNGQREGANGFILNGVTVQETGFSGAGAIPNLDSIAEFRILTNNFDAEYGNYSGGQINVVTKSGTNGWHGNAFEFLRNTKLDAANFFESGNRGSYNQNQFGGTFGGPILKDKLFFFADYQGNRVIQAVPQTINGAPTQAEEGGNLSAIANADGFATAQVIQGVSNGNPVFVPNTVNGAAWANQLTTNQFSGNTGQTVTAGEPYYFLKGDYNPATNTFYAASCTLPTQCVFPNGQLPTGAFSGISTKLLPFIQPANNAQQSSFFTNAGKINLNDNKFSGRVDDNSRFGVLSAYYYYDKFDRIDPYWASPRPTYPGFSIESKGLTDVVNLGDTKTFGSTTVNEARFGFFRLDTPFNQPLGGTGPQDKLAALGFASGANGAPGIVVGTPSVEGIPETDFNNYSIGVPSKPIRITQNSFQLLDNFSKVIGTHTLKFGGQYHYNQLEENLSNAANGNFFFGSGVNGGSSETGSDFVDFLLGAPSSFVQGAAFPSYGRSFYFGLYAQDSWRIKSNLTFNYGLRYDTNSYWRELHNQIETIIPGEQSVVFPGSPKGWVFPGDPGVPSSLAPTRWNNFAPRLGLAYSFGDYEGALGKILGKPGSTSIRVGYGKFYTALEGATNFNEIGDAPFGDFTGQFGQDGRGPTYAAPFTTRSTGNSLQNFFPVPIPPYNFSAGHPATGNPAFTSLVGFLTQFGTIGSSPAFNNNNKSPYAENYELSIQRQITSSDLLTASYVGTQGHHLLLALSANPGSPALCMQLIAEHATPTCGPNGENAVYTLPSGALVGGFRTPLNQLVNPNPMALGVITLASGPTVAFGNDSYFINIGNSAYNSAQINWRHTSGRLQMLLGYTFSKAIDLASGYGEQVNPVNPKLSRGLSAFDSTHNFVVSYNYRLPFDMLPGPKRLTNGWEISGITRFATGLPVTLVETDDQSLLGTNFGGPIPLSVDTPNIVAPVKKVDPRSTGQCPGLPTASLLFFCPSSFQSSALGLEGTANRRFFHGPGVNNWDFAVLKNTQVNERFNLQFRAELFNIWNHAQFLGPSGVLSSSFGQVSQAALPRIGQLSLKLNF